MNYKAYVVKFPHFLIVARAKHPNDSVLRGEGIEVKASRQKGGWQGHNPEGWVMIFRYGVDVKTEPIENGSPTEIMEVFAARLNKKDWSFGGRKGESRRTISASIIRSGMDKLRSNSIYNKNQSFL